MKKILLPVSLVTLFIGLAYYYASSGKRRARDNNKRTAAYYCSHKKATQDMYRTLKQLAGKYPFDELSFKRRFAEGSTIVVQLEADTTGANFIWNFSGHEARLDKDCRQCCKEERAKWNAISADGVLLHALDVIATLQNSVVTVNKNGIEICMDLPSMMEHDEREFSLQYMPFSLSDMPVVNTRDTLLLDSNIYIYCGE